MRSPTTAQIAVAEAHAAAEGEDATIRIADSGDGYIVSGAGVDLYVSHQAVTLVSGALVALRSRAKTVSDR